VIHEYIQRRVSILPIHGVLDRRISEAAEGLDENPVSKCRPSYLQDLLPDEDEREGDPQDVRK
jgi:hypothetical protein